MCNLAGRGASKVDYLPEGSFRRRRGFKFGFLIELCMCVWLKARLLKSISCYFGGERWRRVQGPETSPFRSETLLWKASRKWHEGEKRRNRSTENIKLNKHQMADMALSFLSRTCRAWTAYQVAQQHHCDPGTVKSLLIAPENSSMLTFSRSQKLSNSKMDFQRRYFWQCRRCFQSYPYVDKSQQKLKHVTKEFAESNTTTDLCVAWLFVDGCRDQRSCQG